MVIKMGQGTLKIPRARTEIQFSIINMPHSERRRTGITKHIYELNEAIKRLKSSSSNYNENAQVITVSTTLGELRRITSTRDRGLPDSILNSLSTFQRVPFNPNRPLIIYGSDGGLIAYRTMLNNKEIVDNLINTIRELPMRANHKVRGVYRGKYLTRHYCTWSPYSKKPFISGDLKKDREAGLEFLRKNQELWSELSDIFGGIAPNIYKSFLRYPLPTETKRFGIAWAGCVVNIGDQDPVQTPKTKKNPSTA